MNIKKFELRKVIFSPIFIVLIIVFLIYNTLIIFNKSYIKDDINVLNEIVNTVGYKINDEMIINFEEYYNNKMSDINDILNKKGYESCKTLGEFLDTHEIIGSNNYTFTVSEIKYINKVALIENYFFLSKNLESSYSKLNIGTMTQEELEKNPYNKKMTNKLMRNYDKMAIRFNELKSNNEHKNLFFYGKVYKMHSFLFKSILKTIIFEIIILGVLFTSYIMNFEFENKTAPIVYTTKKGRNLIWDKLLISLILTLLISTILIGITLLIYFIVFDYSTLWNTSVSSFFSQEYNLPYIAWWNISFKTYLIVVISLIYVLEILFSTIAFVLSSFIKNNYIVFGIFFLLVGIGILLPSLVPSKLSIIMDSVYTPFTLLINPSWWFMMKYGLNSHKYYEIITVLIWSIALIFISILCIKKFKKESIN